MDGTTEPQRVKALPTGYPELDLALGVGGLPEGRLVEVTGPESAGKTTIILRLAALAQQAGRVAAYIDLDHHFDPAYAVTLGVDMAALLISQPDNAEIALEIVETLTRSGAVDLILVDSYQHLMPRTEIDGEAFGDPGLVARLASQSIRKLTAAASRLRTIIVFTGQQRDPRLAHVSTGIGNALKFYSSVRLDVRRIPETKQTRVRVVKNKVAVPFREAILDLHAPTVQRSEP